MRLSIVGVTGLVGQKILTVLEEHNIYPTEFMPVASESSVNKTLVFQGKSYKIMSIQDAIDKSPDLVIFSAGKEVSKKYAPKFAEKGSYVIDNSSAWRMLPEIKLIVPEVNSDVLSKNDKIISNPNCSTIQLAVVLYPLHKLYKLKRVIVSTYQSVTGSGVAGVKQLKDERAGKSANKPAYPHNIDLNCIPQGGEFLDNLYTEEEWKLVKESQKILDIENLKISASVVRVPVYGGHSESVNIEFFNNPNLNEIHKVLKESAGIIVQDDVKNNLYPMPISSEDKDEVFVGRLRYDNSCENAINLWICADNLRKGAATNAVQIAELVYNKFIK